MKNEGEKGKLAPGNCSSVPLHSAQEGARALGSFFLQQKQMPKNAKQRENTVFKGVRKAVIHGDVVSFASCVLVATGLLFWLLACFLFFRVYDYRSCAGIALGFLLPISRRCVQSLSGTATPRRGLWALFPSRTAVRAWL